MSKRVSLPLALSNLARYYLSLRRLLLLYLGRALHLLLLLFTSFGSHVLRVAACVAKDLHRLLGRIMYVHVTFAVI